MSLQNSIQKMVADAVQSALAPYLSVLNELVALNGNAPKAAVPEKKEVKQKPLDLDVPPEKLCAIMGCPRPSRTKGYCGAHYQKRFNLLRSDRLPATWVEHAIPQSVEDVKLPRGKAVQVVAPTPTDEVKPAESVTEEPKPTKAAKNKKSRKK